MLLQHLFLESVTKHAERIAVIDKTTGKEFTYAQLCKFSIALSQIIKSDSPYVGICVPTSAGCMIAVSAVLLAGKIPVMINYATGADKNARFAQGKCGFSTILTSKGLLQKLNLAPVNGMIFLEDLFTDLPKTSAITNTYTANEDDTALILFTSGSEKLPKCVQLTHKNIRSNALATKEHLHIVQKDIFASVLPLYHSFGFTVNMWLPISAGAMVITHASPLEYASIVETIRDYKATVLMGSSSFFRGYLKKSVPGDFTSVRLMVAGAEKLRSEVRNEYLEKHGVNILEGYGCTETSPVVCVNQPWNNAAGSIGTCIPGVSIKIIDPETGADLGRNREGKILVTGDLVMKGYLDNPEANGATLIDGWYDTGDMGVYDDSGRLWHRGRLKRFVKIAGEMVSIVAIEEAIDSILQEGTQVCVVAVPDPEKGAKLVATFCGPINRDATNAHIAATLGNLMVPTVYHELTEMPVMGTGKIDFKRIEEICVKHYGR
jgi:acyl-[acyl-carrier-protein]-phospholipid O-acyltransferase/long-chain-fatty-acid--[acyl-carrier-protein] ligase